jgi:hypothetical protein
MKDQQLTNQQCAEHRLPGHSPIEPYEELDWFPISRADVRPGAFEEVARILGGDSGKAA